MTVPVPAQLEFISDGDGVTTSFSYPVRFLEKSEIVVAFRDVNGDDTIKSLNIDYSIAGTSWDEGGTISFYDAPPVGVEVVRYRQTQAKQIVDLGNKAKNNAEAVEQQLDRLAMVNQDNKWSITNFLLRAARFPFGYTGSNILPNPEPNKFLAWNEAGNRIVNKVVVSVEGLLAGVAGLAILAKDTLVEAQTYLGITAILDNLGVVNFSTGKLLNSTQVDLPIVVLATGQSNMLGHTTTGGDRTTKNNSVYVLEVIPDVGQTTGWKRAGPDSPDWPFLPTGNSLAYQFCDRLQRKTGRTVLMIMVAAGGQPIAEWLPGGGGAVGATGTMFSQINAALILARSLPVPGRTDGLTLTGTGRIRADYMLWHQGEADANYQPAPGAGTKAAYKARFRTMINTMRDPASGGSGADPFLWTQTPVIMGELLWGGMSGPNPTDDRNDALAELERENPLFALASSRSLPSLDNLHIAGSGLVEFGDRYFDKMGLIPRILPKRESINIIDLGGGAVLQWGTATVNTGGSTVVTLAVNMLDTNYVPTLTLVTSGTSTPSSLRSHTFAVSQFQIENNTGSNQTVRWQVIGMKSV